MSLFKNKQRRRNIRKKVTEEQEEDVGGGDDISTGGGGDDGEKVNGETSTAPTQKKKETRAMLSFEDELTDEDGPVFKVKKTTLSRKAAKMAERERKEKKTKKREMFDDEEIEFGGGGEIESEEEEEETQQVPLSQQLRGGGFIPNAEFIHRARREREERRQQGDGVGGASGFLSLQTKKKIPAAKGKSRLVREDDNDRSEDEMGEEEEDGGRRRMDAGQHDMTAVKQFQVLQGLEEVESDEDEEIKRWEEEQILKGVKASAPEQTNSDLSHLSEYERTILTASGYSDLSGIVGGGGGGGGGVYMASSYVPTTVQTYSNNVPLEATPTGRTSLKIPEKLVPITVESLKSRLSNRLCVLQDSLSGHRERLDQIRTDLERSREEVGGAEAQRGDLGMQYQFYQEMRGYLRDLLHCLGEKEPQIIGMEKKIGKVRKERADLLLSRRRQDITDQDKECTETNGVQMTSSDEVLSRQRRSVEREGRRRRRRERREKEKKKEEHRQGLSSDDELLEINRLKFENEIKKTLERRDDVFDDVVEEFHQLSDIKQRLEDWKFGFSASYSQAHISLYLPQFFSPFVRLELLDWNPLHDDCPDFEEMEWYETLMFYGFREGEEPDSKDPDTHLLPQLIDHVIIPKLTVLAQQVWDPLSKTQTHRLISLIRHLASDYPTVSQGNKNTQNLFTAVLTRLRRATEEDVFIPLYTTSQVGNSLSPQTIFYNQQFWSCVKLLGNITAWEGLVSPDALQELVLDGLLNKYLVLALQTCPSSNLSVIKTGAIISRLPVSWLSDGTTVTRPLQNLVVYLCQLAQQLIRSTLGHPDHLRQNTRLVVKEVAGQLVRIGAVKESKTLCHEHNISLSPPPLPPP